MLPILKALTLALLTAASAAAFAADGPIDDADFFQKASAAGVAEVEAGKLAQEKGTSARVKDFAKTMVSDHSAANAKLAELAKQKNVAVEDEATLVAKAKELILKLRGENSFDVAYANNQVEAHKEAVALFKQAAQSKDADVAAFANKTLPTLEHHLQMAEALAKDSKAAH